MFKNISALLFIVLVVLLFTAASAQEKRPVDLPTLAQNPSQELLWVWNDVGRKVISMAEDFPEEKYAFKAQKDERTFAENLIHIAFVEYIVIGAIKGTTMGPVGNEDTLRKLYPTKADIVKLLKQAEGDGTQLIKEQGDIGLTREYKYPWGNMMAHCSFGWWSLLEHTGEHYGQLVVYYRVNDMIPPESRPKK